MLTLLHDPNNAASTAFLALFGASGTVITGHDACVAEMPNIQGYPSVVYKGQTLFNPVDMAAVTAWQHEVDNPPGQTKPTVISQYEFTMRFTQAERKGILVAMKTDIDVEDAKTVMDKAQVIDLENPMTIGGVQLLASKGLLTPERAQEILKA